MNTTKKKIVGALLGFIAISIVFILMSFLSHTFENEIRQIIGHDTYYSRIIYVLITIFAIVLAPVSTLPLIPIVSNVWGWLVTAILSITGWVIGAQIAFLLARKLGKPFIEKFFSLEKIHSLEGYFTHKHLFWTVVFLRILLPVDLLSYALGLFSKMKSSAFFFATIIGVAPFAFIFSYVGNMSIRLQILTLIETLGAVGLICVIYIIVKKRKLL
ncbi:VTT domain-containing protein [Candidatus Gracilibacteria bacterium]|nr:VTT domain-containing protein [Candidatus Gracilibacteria bacterium]MCF7898734.1 VTT domain-containing protein [Candidatus Paceibacterota bacterium]